MDYFFQEQRWTDTFLSLHEKKFKRIILFLLIAFSAAGAKAGEETFDYSKDGASSKWKSGVITVDGSNGAFKSNDKQLQFDSQAIKSLSIESSTDAYYGTSNLIQQSNLTAPTSGYTVSGTTGTWVGSQSVSSGKPFTWTWKEDKPRFTKIVVTYTTGTPSSPTAPTADFTYGSTKWTSPTQDEMTITVPSHKGGKTFAVTLSNISNGATPACTQYGTLSDNTLTITAPTSTASDVAEQTTTVTLTKESVTTTYNIKVTTEAKTGITFDPKTRYSQLLIDNRTTSFYANTKPSGINSESGYLDYVPGLVAKAMIEAVDYYKDNPAGDITLNKVKGWFDKVQGYGDSHTIKDPGTKGESFDDLNAVKLYFGLKSVAASGKLSGITDNTSDWNEKIKSALAGIKTANTNYVIKSGTGETDMQGGWWHKSKYVNQMWCDGQYMGTALLAQMINDDQYKVGDGGNSVTGTETGD